MSQKLRKEQVAKRGNSARWGVIWVVLATIVGGAVALGMVALLLIVHTVPPPIVHTDPSAAQRLRQELENAQTASVGGNQSVVSADETEVNSLLKEYLHAINDRASGHSSAVLRDVKVNLAEDRLRMYLLTRFQGRDVSLELEAKIHTANGYLDLEPVSGQIGSLPIPGRSLRRAVEQMLAAPNTRQMLRLPSNLSDLRVENGKFVVVFK